VTQITEKKKIWKLTKLLKNVTESCLQNQVPKHVRSQQDTLITTQHVFDENSSSKAF
jgi:hypothetical protein